METPENIRPEQKHGLNSHEILLPGCNSIEEAVEKRIKDTGVKVRSNSVKAIEYVLALSPDVQNLYKDYSASAVLTKMLDFVDKRHGKENVVSVSQHFDESNPHVHFVVVPIIRKKKKWKNSNGAGEKIDFALSARDFVGTRAKLRQLQTDFYEFCKETYSERLNIDFKRGTDARKQTKKYTKYPKKYSKHASAEIGELRDREMELLAELKNIRHQKSQEQNALYKRDSQLREERKNQKGKDSFERLDPFKNYPADEKKGAYRSDKNKNKGLTI